MFQTFQNIVGYFSKGAKPITDKIKKALFAFRISRSYLWKVKAEFQNYRSALDLAQSPILPDRRALYAFYRETELDDQVITQARIATVTVQRAPFEVMSKKKKSNDLTDLFKRPWFFDFLDVSVKTELWGHSLLEFNPAMNDKKEFVAFWVIPRDHVRPEFGDVTLQTGSYKGVEYRNNPEFPYTLEMGRPDDIGLYSIVTIPALRKRYADTDWSLFSERFGSPFLTIKTTSRDKKELDAKEEMAANFASNGYAILDDQDEISTIMANHNGTAHRTFSERMDKADNQIARLINGQSSASDEKAYVGSAEVHERILNDFTFARLYRIQYYINFQLIPFLVEHGYPLADATFEFTELREREEKKASADQDDEPKKKLAVPEKKSPAMNNLGLFYNPYFHGEGCNCPGCQMP